MVEQMGVEPISKTLHFGFKPCRNHSYPKLRKVDLAKSLYASLVTSSILSPQNKLITRSFNVQYQLGSSSPRDSNPTLTKRNIYSFYYKGVNYQHLPWGNLPPSYWVCGRILNQYFYGSLVSYSRNLVGR